MLSSELELLMIEQMKPQVRACLQPGSGFGENDPLAQAMIKDRAWFALSDYCEEIFDNLDEGRHFAGAMRELARLGEI